MEWTYKGINFVITTERLGPFFLLSAETPKTGLFVRVRPFSALGKTEEEALEILKKQIAMEYRRVPEHA